MCGEMGCSPLVLKEQAFGAVVHDNVVAIDSAKKK
jgi:hypothetical protein